MRRDLRAFMWDVGEAISSVQSFLTGKNLAEYRQDKMLRLRSTTS